MTVPSGDRLHFTYKDAESENGKIWWNQIEGDWKGFIEHREVELKKSGRLAILIDLYD